MRDGLSCLSTYLRALHKCKDSYSYKYVEGASRLVILHERNTPTLGYFGPSLEAQYPRLPVTYMDINVAPTSTIFSEGDLVVVVRYLNDAWRNVLMRSLSDLAGLIYFMDDDLLDRQAMSGLPRPYVKRLERKALHYRNWFEYYCSELWVGTDMLARKYKHFVPKVIYPAPVSVARLDGKPLRVAYHGSGSHIDEVIWLRDIIEQIIKANKNIHIELFGDHAVNRLFRDISRISVLHPMSWGNYIAYALASPSDILLVPLTDSLFNKGRGYTKFFDAARMKAVGIYSRVPPYEGFVRNGIDGLLLKNEKSEWVNAVLNLATDHQRRQRLASSCLARSRGMICNVDNDLCNR